MYAFTITVRRMAKKFGMKEVSEDDDWTLYWTDFSVALERVMEMKRYQVSTRKFKGRICCGHHLVTQIFAPMPTK